MKERKRRPNVLYIMTDQLRADWLGCYGHPVVKTPNIDALAGRGTRYERFYVTSPVCMPNRGAIFTGRYPSVNGLRHNGLYLPKDSLTFVELLRADGFNTALIGKSHLQPFTDRPINRDDEEIAINSTFPEAKREADFKDYRHEEPGAYGSKEYTDLPSPYYGFEHIRMVTGHGDTCGGHYKQWLDQRGRDELLKPENELPHNYSVPQAYRTPIPEDHYHTSYIRDEAKAYLASREGTEEPFFAFVSFPDPHHPFNPPGKYWDMYNPDEFEVDLPFEAHKNPPPQLQAWKEMMDQGIVPDNPQQPFMASEQHIKEAMALTAGMLTMIDDAIGEILQTLRDSGLEDDTIIIFNSDHGDYMGAFNLLLKGPLPHHSVNRVPFIWAEPGQAKGRVESQLATAVDIAPSILERCGVLPFFGMQGQSFLSQTNQPRQRVLIEHEENKRYPGFERRPIIRNLVTETHRMTIYKGLEFGEIYDLAADPQETFNLWNEPCCVELKHSLMTEMSQAMLEAIEIGPWPERVA